MQSFCAVFHFDACHVPGSVFLSVTMPFLFVCCLLHDQRGALCVRPQLRGKNRFSMDGSEDADRSADCIGCIVPSKIYPAVDVLLLTMMQEAIDACYRSAVRLRADAVAASTTRI